MSKTKERSEVEYLRSENKRLKSENRHLKRQLGKTDKKVKAYEAHLDLVEPELPETEVSDNRSICTKCGDNQEVVDLGVRILIVCSNCNTRKSFKK